MWAKDSLQFVGEDTAAVEDEKFKIDHIPGILIEFIDLFKHWLQMFFEKKNRKSTEKELQMLERDSKTSDTEIARLREVFYGNGPMHADLMVAGTGKC